MQTFDSFLNENPSGQITVRHIFQDNDNWLRYRYHHKYELREVEVKEVEKMLRCHQDGKGFFVYYCPHCKESWVVSTGYNSRFCSECGKAILRIRRSWIIHHPEREYLENLLKIGGNYRGQRVV